MSMLTREFVDLMAKKRSLEETIQSAIEQFESDFGNVVTISHVNLLKIERLGESNTQLVTVSLEIR